MFWKLEATGKEGCLVLLYRLDELEKLASLRFLSKAHKRHKKAQLLAQGARAFVGIRGVKAGLST